jgi:hypothetical protein
MAERTAMDDAGEGDDHEHGADDTPPPSIARFFTRDGPPTAEEGRRFKRQFLEVVAAYTRPGVGPPSTGDTGEELGHENGERRPRLARPLPPARACQA